MKIKALEQQYTRKTKEKRNKKSRTKDKQNNKTTEHKKNIGKT